jgi:hypothetical protein
MATTGMATTKDGTIFRSVRTRGLLLYAMRQAGLIESPARWLAGVKYHPRDCRGLGIGTSVWYCDDPNDDDLDAGAECVAWVEQFAFDIQDALTDSTLARNEDEMRMLLESRYTEMISWAFAATLVGLNSQFNAASGLTLPTQAHAPDGGFPAATPIAKAMAILENDLAKTLHGAEGMIHLSPGLLYQAANGGGLILDDGTYRTPSGHTVVGDAGYYRAAAPTGQATSTANTSDWAYASGPIEYQATPFNIKGEMPEAFVTISDNRVNLYSQEHGIFLFDPCAVTAVLVSY